MRSPDATLAPLPVSRRRSIPVLAVAAALVAGVSAFAPGPRVARPSAPADAARAPRPAAPDFRFTGDFRGPLGVQLYSFRGAMRAGDVAATLGRVRALGFREVELAGTYGMSAAAFRRALDDAGLQATSMHVGYERLRDSLPAVIAEAKALGVPNVGTAWIPHAGGPITVDFARKTATDFDRWGRALRAAGLQFFYHVHGYEFQAGSDGVRPIDALIRGTDRDAVKYEMDVFWTALPGADPVALLRQYPGRWRLMHLKDMRQGVSRTVQTGGANPDSAEVPVGTGQIDYRAVLRAAKEVGVQRYYIEDETADPFATVPRSTRWLEAVRY